MLRGIQLVYHIFFTGLALVVKPSAPPRKLRCAAVPQWGLLPQAELGGQGVDKAAVGSSIAQSERGHCTKPSPNIVEEVVEKTFVMGYEKHSIAEDGNKFLLPVAGYVFFGLMTRLLPRVF